MKCWFVLIACLRMNNTPLAGQPGTPGAKEVLIKLLDKLNHLEKTSYH